MKYIPLFLIFFASFLPLSLAAQAQDKSFAVVELFSSEGCSSCPPADRLVSQLTSWARQNGLPVYPLIFHVDYWNDLGWQDRFSTPEYTRRQVRYSQVLSGGVYTPEMVVNGMDAFVGSDQPHLQGDLNRFLTIPADVILRIRLAKQGSDLIVKYVVDGAPDSDVVNIALVERGLSTQVTAGENAGALLHHDNVVREFKSVALSDHGSQVNISLQKVTDIKNASVIVYVQNPQTMAIETAKQLDLVI